MEIVDCSKVEIDGSIWVMFILLQDHVCLLLTQVAWLTLGFVLKLPRVPGHNSGRQETSSKVSFWAVSHLVFVPMRLQSNSIICHLLWEQKEENISWEEITAKTMFIGGSNIHLIAPQLYRCQCTVGRNTLWKDASVIVKYLELHKTLVVTSGSFIYQRWIFAFSTE